RQFDGIAEFRLTVDRSGPMSDLRVEIEPAPDVNTNGMTEHVATVVRDNLHFTPQVVLAQPGTLPRFEMKAKRVVNSNDGHTIQ
ncbi:MAG: phenylacetate--CoA ligase family protein, partial [Phycisphaerae bacterium]